MRKDLQDKLYAKYPGLFAQKDLPMTETGMCWGVECGDGWFKIIDEACEELSKLQGIQFSQVKEKFGGLRLYLDTYDEGGVADKIIHKAEKESYKTCENCGKPGKPNKSGWISTLCTSCRKSQHAANS